MGGVVRRSWLVGLPLLLVVLAGCGAEEQPTLGEFTGTAGTRPTSTAAPRVTTAASPSAEAQSDTAPDAGPIKGGGDFVYDSGKVIALVRLPADSNQVNVAAFKTFLRKAHAPSLKIVSITVTNKSAKSFSVNGFQVHTNGEDVALYPAATFVNLAMALPGVGQKSDLATAGVVVSLTSVTAVPAGGEVTTLVATQQEIGTVSKITYGSGASAVTLKPLWEVARSRATLPRQLAQAVQELARKQADAAHKRVQNS